jgi:hypothetical protein
MIESLVTEFGEQPRKMIESAIKFLESEEKLWGLDTPIDRTKFVANLIKRRTND